MTDQEFQWRNLSDWATTAQKQEVAKIWAEVHLKIVVEALKEFDIACFLVGGVVRDLLLDRPCNDIDLVVECSPEALFRHKKVLARQTKSTPVPLDEVRGTLRLCFRDGEEIDLVSMQGPSLLEDLLRRDLRINAMAIDSGGRLADPTGGMEDLENRQICSISAGNLFSDPLRVIRCLRFAAQLDFQIEARTCQNMESAVSGLFRVAGERISAELRKFFAAAMPKHMAAIVNLDLPELLLGGEHTARGHRLDLMRGASTAGPLGIGCGLALLFGPVLESQGSRKELFSRLKLSREEQRYLAHWWSGAEVLLNSSNLDKRQIFELSRISKEAFADLARVVKSTPFGQELTDEDRERLNREAAGDGELRWDPLPWNGSQILELSGRETGPWVGKVMRELECRWACCELSTLEEAKEVIRDC